MTVVPAEAGTPADRRRALTRRGPSLRRGDGPTASFLQPADPPPLPPHHPDLELDLDRHQGPARHRPAVLVGDLPLRHRRRGDVRLGGGERRDAAHRPPRPSPRRLVRDPAILPQLQLRLCRRASCHLRPGRDRLRAADGAEQRARLAVPQAEGDLAASSPGSAIACVGVALLFVQEMRASPTSPERGAARHRPHPARSALRLGRQRPAGEPADARPGRSPACSPGAWSTASSPTPCSPGPSPARRSIEARPAYWLGLVYLGLFASALAFPLYFAVMRAVGPGKAAYSSVLVPILAMVLLDPLRRLSLVDARRRRRPARPGRPGHRAEVEGGGC